VAARVAAYAVPTWPFVSEEVVMERVWGTDEEMVRVRLADLV
jgi:hypothetical protein